MTNEQTIRVLALELTDELTSLSISVDSLDDIKVLLGRLFEDMVIAEQKGEEKLFFREHFRTVRILWNLIRCTLDDLNKNFENTHSISNELFQKVGKKTFAKEI